jgi:predicted dehydrogenase
MAFIPALAQLRKSKLISVYSSSPERAKEVAEKFGLAHHFSSYQDFLNSGIDAVYIASANHNHYNQVIKAAEAGKNILCEKPLALNSTEADEMIKACEKNKVHLAVNYVYRFHPLVLKAKELLAAEMIGKLVSINLNFNIDLPPGTNFRYNKESGGGSLKDIGTHMIDLLRFFGGDITAIKGVVDNIIYKSNVDDFAAAIVKFIESGYGYFNVSFNSKKAFNRIEIIGHLGAISIENLIARRNQPSKLTILLEGEARKSFRKRANKLLNLLKSVQNSFIKNETPLVTGYDGLINLKIMEKLEKQCL